MSNTRELMVTLGADTSSYTDKMKRARELTRALESEFKALASSSEKFENSIEGLAKKQSLYNDKIKLSNQLMDANQQRLKETREELEKSNKEYDEAIKKRDKLKQAISKAAKGSNEEKALTKELEKVQQIIDKSEKDIKRYNSRLINTEKSMDDISASTQQWTREMAKARESQMFFAKNNAFDKMKTDIKEVEREFNLLSTSTKGYGQTIESLKNSQKHYSDILARNKNLQKEYSNGIKESQDIVDFYKQDLEQLQNKLREYQNTLNSMDKNDSNFARTREEVEKLRQEIANNNGTIEFHQERIESLNREYRNTQNAVASAKNSLNQVNSEIKQTNNSMKKLATKKIFEGLDRRIQAVNNEFKQLSAELNLAKAKMEHFENSIFSVSQRQEHLRRQISATQTQISNYANSISATETHINSLEKEYAKIGREIEKVKLAMQNAVPDSQEYLELASDLRELENAYDRVDAEIVEHRNNLSSLRASYTNAQADAQRLSGSLEDSLGDALIGTGDRIANFGQAIQGAGYAMLPLTVGIGALGAKVIQTGTDFQRAMSEVSAMSGAVGSDFEKLSRKAREMGATTIFSATDAANALKYLALAGYNTQQAIATLPQILQLAQAGAMDLALASDLATDSISSLGFIGDDAVAQLPDHLNRTAAAAMNSNASIEQLLSSFIRVGGQIDNLNIDLNTSAAMLGVLANRGIKAEEAGNSLNSILINMTKKTGESAKGMAALGVSVFDAQGNIRDMESVLMDMGVALSKLDSDEQRVNIINMIGGKTQAKTLQKLLQGIVTDTGELTEEYKSLKGEIESGIETNALEKMSEIMTDNLYGDLQNLKSMVQEAFLSLYDALEPILRKVTQSITNFVKRASEGFNRLGEGTQKFILAIVALSAAIAPLLIVLGTLSQATGFVMSGLGKMLKESGKIKGRFADLTKIISKVGALLSGLSVTTIAVSGAFAVLGIAIAKMWADGQKKTIEGANAITKGLSSTAKEIAEPFIEATQNVDSALLKLKSSSSAITSEMSSEVTKNISNLASQTTQMLEESSEKSVKILEKNLSAMGNVEESQGQHLIQSVKSVYDNKVKTVQDGQKRISEILGKAREEQRGLNQQELAEVQSHTEKIKQISMLALTTYSAEMKTVKERMLKADKELNAESLANAIKGAKERKEKTVEQATNELNELVAIKEAMKGQLSEQDQQLLNDAIASATTRKNETIRIAEEEYGQLVAAARQGAGDMVNQIDWATGEIKTKWQSFWDGLDMGAGGFVNKLTNKTHAISTTIQKMSLEFQISIEKIKKLWYEMWNQDDKAQQSNNRINKLQAELDGLRNLADQIDATMGRFQALPNDLANIGGQLDLVLQQHLGVNVTEFANNVNGSLDKVKEDFDSLPPEVQNALIEFNNAFIQQGVGGGMEQFIMYLQGKIPYVRMELQDLSDSAETNMTAMENAFTRHADAINGVSFGEFVVATQTNVEQAKQIWDSLPPAVRTSIQNMPKEDWAQIMQYFISTTQTGMTETGNVIEQTGKENAQKSKQAGQETGMAHGEGYQEGIQQGMSGAEQTTTNLVDKVSQGMDKGKETANTKGRETGENFNQGLDSSIGGVELSTQKIETALQNIDNIRLGNVTLQLSEINNWMNTVATASTTLRNNIQNLSTVGLGNVTMQLSQIQMWMGTVSLASISTANSLQSIASVGFGRVTSQLSQIQKWMGVVSVNSKVTRVALQSISGVSFGRVTSQLSQVRVWTNAVTKSSITARQGLYNITTVTYGKTTKGLSEVNRWLIRDIQDAQKLKTALHNITTVTYGRVTKGLSEVNRWLQRVASTSNSARAGLNRVAGASFGSVLSGLRSISSLLSTISSKSSRARSSLASMRVNRARMMDAPEVPDMQNFTQEINRTRDIAKEIDFSRFKTSGGLYSPTPMGKESNVYRANGDVDILNELIKQNNLLLNLIKSNININTLINLDGRQIAKASATYVQDEIDKINNRKARLSGYYGL